MKNLIREIQDFNKTSIEEKQSEGKGTKFSAPFMTADSKNKNNRRYPFETLQSAIKEFSSKVGVGKGFGADNHPASGNVNISDISHRITKIFMKDKVAYIEGEILAGEKGKKILQIVKSGGVLGVSARGFGEMKKAKDGVNEIQKGYSLAGIDFVVNPSENVATIDKGNIFESAPIIQEEKFDVSLEEFNKIVDKAIKHEFSVSFPDANFLEPNVKKCFKKYVDEHWAWYGKIIEEELKPLIVQKSSLKIEKTKRTEEDKLYHLYQMEYLPSGGKRTFGEYCKIMEEK